MLQDCSSIFTAARYVTIANKISDPLNFEYIYISTRLYSVRSMRALHSQRRISLRGWKTAQNWKKKKKKVESYMSPFHGLPRPLLQRRPLTCCSIYPQSGQKREENASSPRRKNALFIHRVYSFLCCKLVTVPVNSATANKAWWNNCRLVLRDKRVDRLTRLLLQIFSHH